MRVTAGGEKQWQMMRSGSSYLSASELVLTFGLGTRAKADSIEVQWPGGAVEKIADVAAGETVTIREGGGIVGSRPYAHK